MTMTYFIVGPRIVNVDRIKRIYGYLCERKRGAMRLMTEEPDTSSIPGTHYDWEEHVCNKVEETLTEDEPE